MISKILLLFFCFCICIVGHCKELDDSNKNATSNDLLDKINKFKEQAQEITGIKRPEDIPEVNDWLKSCEKKVGRRKFRVIKTSRSKMVECLTNHVDMSELEGEINDSMKKGELDLVFKKYCGKRDQVLICIDDVLEHVKPCMNEQQLKGLNFTRDAVNAGIDFVCHENGDRIALFMSEDGVECLQNNTDVIKDCIETKIPEMKQIQEDLKTMKIDQFLVNDQNCEKLSTVHQCVVSATTTCDDPTPSNILDSLITQALKVTPCQASISVNSSSSGFYKHFRVILPHFLIVVAAGLTAAQILL